MLQRIQLKYKVMGSAFLWLNGRVPGVVYLVICYHMVSYYFKNH